jgi:hypothetical protein
MMLPAPLRVVPPDRWWRITLPGPDPNDHSFPWWQGFCLTCPGGTYNEARGPTNSVAECVIITTGRTASSHLEQAWKAQGKKSFEHTRRIDQRFLNAESSVLNWREDQWECASSLWIMIASNRVLHNVKGNPLDNYDFQVPAITQTWIDNDWTNMSKLVLDHSLFFKYVLKKSVLIMPTEYVIEHYQSPHGKMSYEKNKIIQEYNESMSKYNSSNTRHLFNTLYNNTIRLLKD